MNNTSPVRKTHVAVAIPSSIHQVLCHVLGACLLVLLAVLTSGCSKRYDDMPAFSPIPLKQYDNQSVGRFKTSYLAEQIDEFYRGVNPGPLGITTFVNLDDLYTTSSFGRMVSEQMMSELTMRGFDVVELRHSDALQFMNTTGEFALSRDSSSVRNERKLGGVIVGTYVVSPIRVYVNARLVDPSSSVVLSAGSVEMEKTTELVRLLRGGGVAPTLERIPVKHIGLATFPAMAFPNQMGRVYDLEESGPMQQQPSVAARPFVPTPVEPKLPDLAVEGAKKEK